MIVLYIVILIYFNFDITSIVNVFMLSIEKTKTTTATKKRIVSKRFDIIFMRINE